MTWTPPKSPHSLIQEQLYEDPWKILVACVFCNLTRRHQAEPILWKFFKRYPTPEAARKARPKSLERLLKPLGLWERRAKTLIRMSDEYLTKDWEDPIELYGIGKYASDAWHIFCKGDWRDVEPKDHALNDYHEFLKEHFGEEQTQSAA